MTPEQIEAEIGKLDEEIESIKKRRALLYNQIRFAGIRAGRYYQSPGGQMFAYVRELIKESDDGWVWASGDMVGVDWIKRRIQIENLRDYKPFTREAFNAAVDRVAQKVKGET